MGGGAKVVSADWAAMEARVVEAGGPEAATTTAMAAVLARCNGRVTPGVRASRERGRRSSG